MSNTKTDLRKVEWGYMDWIHLAQDTGRWKVLGNATMNLRVQ